MGNTSPKGRDRGSAIQRRLEATSCFGPAEALGSSSQGHAAVAAAAASMAAAELHPESAGPFPWAVHWNRCQQHRIGMHQSFRQWTSTAHSINQSFTQPTSHHQCTIVERSMPGTIQSERTSGHDDDTETEHRLTTATETMNNDSSDKLVDVIRAF